MWRTPQRAASTLVSTWAHYTLVPQEYRGLTHVDTSLDAARLKRVPQGAA
jgi:hypothetical protein